MWQRSFIKQAPGGIIWSAVGTLVFNGGAAMLGVVASIPLWLYIPLISVTTAASLVIANQILQFRDRYRQGRSGIPEEHLEQTILQWLANGYSVKKPDKVSEDAYFTWIATDAVGREFGVTRLKSDPERISIWEGYRLTDEELEAIKRLPPQVYQEVAEDMSIDIAAFNIEIGTGVAHQQPDSPKDSTSEHNFFYLRHRVIFGNQFDVDDFYEGVSFVYRATTVVSQYLQRMLRLAAQHSDSQRNLGTPDV
jgi:hypothetical protein